MVYEKNSRGADFDVSWTFDPSGDQRERIEIFAYQILEGIQDAIAHVTTEPWPSTERRTSSPHLEWRGDELWLSYRAEGGEDVLVLGCLNLSDLS